MEHTTQQETTNNINATQHTPTTKSFVKKVKSLPSKTDISKAFEKPKSTLDFDEKELVNIKDGLSFFNTNLQADNEAERKSIVKAIETLIDATHKTFSKDFKDYKKNCPYIEKTFLTDYFNSCNERIKAEMVLVKQGNEDLKTEVIDRTLDVVSSKINQEIDLLLLTELFSKNKSQAKKETLLKLIKENK